MTDAPTRILPKRHTSMGWAITEIGFEHVPGYDLAEAKKGLSPQSIRTELYRNWDASQNKAVYPEFSKALHAAAVRALLSAGGMALYARDGVVVSDMCGAGTDNGEG